jgi:MFS family permease
MQPTSNPTRPPLFFGHIIVAAALLILIIIWGTNYSFGVFFTPLLREFGWTRAITTGAFGLAMFLEGFGGMFMGRMNDRFGARWVVTVCGLCMGMGLLLMSRITQVWQLYVYYGVMIGIGLSGSYVPLASTVTRWFKKQMGLMVGIIAAGMGLGTMIMTPIANQLIQSYGWRTSYIVVGLGVIVCVAGLAQLVKNPSPGDLPETQRRAKSSGVAKQSVVSIPMGDALKTGQLWLLCTICFLWGGLSLIIFVHIAPHAIDLGFTSAQAASILAVIGGVVFVAKIMLGIVTDMIGSKRTFMVGLAAMTIGLFWLLFSRDMWALYLFAIFFAFGYAGGSVVMPTITAEIFGLGAHGGIFGIINFSACCGVAVGPMAVGWMFDINGDYQMAISFMVAFSVLSLLMTIGIKTGLENNPEKGPLSKVIISK